MVRFYHNEIWKEFEIGYKLKHRYAVSTYGRLMSFSDKFENGRVLKGGLVQGYKAFCWKENHNNKITNHNILVRRLVAESFIPKTSADQEYVLSIDHIKSNNFVFNLKWATKREMIEHRMKNPLVIEGRKKFVVSMQNNDGQKLTSTQVIRIKKKLLDPNRKTRMKMIAKEFGITGMQLYRIKTGENWGHIKVNP